MRRAAPLAAIAVTTLAVGCGEGKRNPPPSGPEAAVRAAAIAGVSGFEPNGQCEQSLTSGLTYRVYGSVARCKRVVGDSAASPNFGVNVIAEKVTGQRARVRVVAKNGDDPDIDGTVTLRYERAAWRIDDFDAQYLRSGLGKAVAGQAEVVDPVLEADIATCVDRRWRRVGDAEIKRLAYGVLGQRRSVLIDVYGELARCDSGGLSLLRRVFERHVLDELQAEPATTPNTLKCVLRGLRVLTSDSVVAAVLASGGIDSRVAQKLLYRAVVRAAAACSAPKPRPFFHL